MKQFDKHAEAYQLIRAKIAYPERLFRLLVKESPTLETALDIGCGNGVSTVRLQRFFKYVEGVDLGENLIQKARETYPGIHFSVSPIEAYTSDRKFDLVTSATSFYWMDRDVVLQRVASVLNESGLFAAYKYDFPVVYGPLRDFIECEMATKWSQTRDSRLTDYDDTLERIQSSGRFRDAKRFVIPNIIQLTPKEVGLFFLSTSYVTEFIERFGGSSYAEDFLNRVITTDKGDLVHVNFDIHLFKARKA